MKRSFVAAVVLLVFQMIISVVASAQDCAIIKPWMEKAEGTAKYNLTVKVSELPAQYANYSTYDDAEVKMGMYGSAYFQALQDKLGYVGAATAAAANAVAVITVVYNDGTQEQFLHGLAPVGSVGNYLIPGSQQNAQGDTLCPNGVATETGGGGDTYRGAVTGAVGGFSMHLVCFDSYGNGKYIGTDCYEAP